MERNSVSAKYKSEPMENVLLEMFHVVAEIILSYIIQTKKDTSAVRNFPKSMNG